MAINRSNRSGRSLRSNIGRTSSLPASPVARPVGRPTPSQLPPPTSTRASVGPTRNGGRSVSPAISRPTPRPTPRPRPQGESPVIRPSRETGGATPPPRTIDKIISDSKQAVVSVKSKDPRPDPPPPPRPDVLPPPPGQVSIIGTVDPTAILKDNQKPCPDDPSDMGDDIQDLIDHIDKLRDEIADIEIPFVEIIGCTDPNALNWNPNANKDSGKCEYEPDPPIEEEEDFTDVLEEPAPPEVKICAKEYEPTEQNIESAKRQAIRDDIGGELESEMKNIWDEQVLEFPVNIDKDNPQYAASQKLKTNLQRNDLGIILLRGQEKAKLNISLNKRFFDAAKYREVIDTTPTALVGRIKSGKR